MTSIVRSLVTKLGFVFDRTNLDKFEKSLTSFRLKATIATGAISYGFKKALNYAEEFSDKILKNSAIAKFSKSSIQEIDALQRAFKKLNVPEDVFQSFFGEISLGIKEASRGVNNNFREIVRQSRGAVRLFVDGQLTTTKQAIDDIMAYIRSIADESEKIRIAQNIFGVDISTANAIVDISKLTQAEYDKIIEKEKRSAELLKAQQQAALEFKQQINALSVEWDKFITSVLTVAVPALTGVFKGINDLIDDIMNAPSKIVGKIGSAINETFDLRNYFDYDKESPMRKHYGGQDTSYSGFMKSEAAKSNFNSSSNSNVTNNKIEVNVAPGTTEQQASVINESILQALKSFNDEKIREVMNNNPQVE